MFTYSAICDVPEEALLHVTALLHAHRRAIGTRTGVRAATERTQAKLVLRWYRDDAAMRILAAEAGLPISTGYRYLHEGIDVIADQGPDLHEVLGQARGEGWSHMTLDGTLIEIDRVDERDPDTGHHLWYSGRHKRQGADVQVIADPRGFPVWSSEVEPGSTHDITAAREHCLGAPPTVCHKGYEGAGIGVHSPVEGRDVAPGTRAYNVAAHRDPRDRGTRQRRTRTTLAMPPPNPFVPNTNRPNRRRRHRPIHATTRNY